MNGAGRDARVVGRGDALPDIAAAIVGAVVLDLELVDPLFQLRGERIVNCIHAAERSVAARGRHFERVEHAGLGRQLQVRHVGVPDRLAGAQAADRLSVHHHVGNHVDLRHAFDEAPAGFLDRGPVELAEAPAERHQIGVAEPLVADEDHRMLVPGAGDPREHGVTQIAEIDSADFGAERCPRGNDLNCSPIGRVVELDFRTGGHAGLRYSLCA